jgi:hypothetical protein
MSGNPGNRGNSVGVERGYKVVDTSVKFTGGLRAPSGPRRGIQVNTFMRQEQAANSEGFKQGGYRRDSSKTEKTKASSTI